MAGLNFGEQVTGISLKSAKVTRFGGRFRVRTETGGEAVVWQHKIDIDIDDERLR